MEHAAKWRQKWVRLPRPIVLAAGTVRRDKRLDALVLAVKVSGCAMSLVVVGSDGGYIGECARLAERLDVDVQWFTKYIPLSEFVGAIAAADIVVCPYERASQSGILSIARSVGVPTIASEVGGLSDLADRTYPVGDGNALAQLLREARERPCSTDGVREFPSVVPPLVSDYRRVVQLVARRP